MLTYLNIVRCHHWPCCLVQTPSTFLPEASQRLRAPAGHGGSSQVGLGILGTAWQQSGCNMLRGCLAGGIAEQLPGHSAFFQVDGAQRAPGVGGSGSRFRSGPDSLCGFRLVGVPFGLSHHTIELSKKRPARL